MKDTFKALSSGVWGVLATPFTNDASGIDEKSLSRLVAFYSALDIAGLTVLGVSGEAAHLTSHERRRVMEVVTDTAGGASLVVGVTSHESNDAIQEIENVQAQAGTHAVGYMIQVNSPHPEAVVANLQAIHAATGVSVVLQDYPGASGVAISVKDLAAVVDSCEFVIAVKLESAPTPSAVNAVTALIDVPVFGGLGASSLLGELACGSSGAMTGFSVPEGLSACWEAFTSGGFDAALTAWLPYMPLISFEFQTGMSTTLRKEALKVRGLIEHNATRRENVSLPDGLVAALRMHLASTPQRAYQ